MKIIKTFLLPFLLLPAFTITADTTPSAPQNIDQQIEFLENKLADLRNKYLNQEIHAQPYMIDNWHQFAEDIRQTEEHEKEILEIKKQINDLKQKMQNRNRI